MGSPEGALETKPKESAASAVLSDLVPSSSARVRPVTSVSPTVATGDDSGGGSELMTPLVRVSPPVVCSVVFLVPHRWISMQRGWSFSARSWERNVKGKTRKIRKDSK